MDHLTVTTTNGELFTGEQACELAYLVYLRFGQDYGAAHSAWKRMLQNNCLLASYVALVEHAKTMYACQHVEDSEI